MPLLLLIFCNTIVLLLTVVLLLYSIIIVHCSTTVVLVLYSIIIVYCSTETLLCRNIYTSEYPISDAYSWPRSNLLCFCKLMQVQQKLHNCRRQIGFVWLLRSTCRPKKLGKKSNKLHKAARKKITKLRVYIRQHHSLCLWG